VLEQVGQLLVDLEGILVVEQVQVEEPALHTREAYYKRIPIPRSSRAASGKQWSSVVTSGQRRPGLTCAFAFARLRSEPPATDS
jgi:hypothetical protein